MIKNYDPKLVTLSFRGVVVTGFAADAFVSAERTEDTYSMDVGSQGDVTRVRNRNKTGTITVTLQAASPSNDVLSAILALDEALGTGKGPVMIKDLNGTTLVTSADAWIRRAPTVERGSGAANVEWMIDCEKLEMSVGGFVL